MAGRFWLQYNRCGQPRRQAALQGYVIAELVVIVFLGFFTQFLLSSFSQFFFQLSISLHPSLFLFWLHYPGLQQGETDLRPTDGHLGQDRKGLEVPRHQ